MQVQKLKITGIILALIIGVLTGIFVNNSRQFANVYIKIDPAADVSIYKNTSKGDTPQYDSESKPLFRLSKSTTLKLKYGSYASVLSDPHHLYQTPTALIKVDQNTTTATIDQTYSAQTLAALLPTARTQAAAALYATYPISVNPYNIGKDGLYGKGDWYGAVITPQNPIQDTVRIIMHKTGTSWNIATTPNITIGKPSNPDIPPAVVEAVDQL